MCGTSRLRGRVNSGECGPHCLHALAEVGVAFQLVIGTIIDA